MLSATSDDNYTANSITEQDGGWWLTELFKTKTKTPDLFNEAFKDNIIESNEKLVKEIIIENATSVYNINMGNLLDKTIDKEKKPIEYNNILNKITDELYKLYLAYKALHKLNPDEELNIKKLIKTKLETLQSLPNKDELRKIALEIE